jgi:hypothetical protein
MLFGVEDFDHSKFPGFGNNSFFVFVDYASKRKIDWPKQPSQTEFLSKSREKLQRGDSVLFRFERERVKEDIFTDAIAQQVLHPHQVSGYRRTDTLTFCIEHVEDHDLVFDEVVVELHLFSVLRGQHEVRKVTLPDSLTRRYHFEFRVRVECLRIRQEGHSKRSRP